jgi:serine/threonine-protein kinase HipA
MTKLKRLAVGTPQGVAGDLRKESRFVFNYTATEKRCEISLTMPVRAESYASGGLLPIFEMNRPEGYLLSKIEEVMAKHGRLDDMRLLAIVGRSQIGRLTYTEPGQEAPPLRARIGLHEILTQQPTTELFDFLVANYFESGISGVQPKVMLPDAERSMSVRDRATVVHSNLIVKATTDEYPHLTQNEFLCMSAAKRAGIPVPNFWLSQDGGLFVLERFDLTQTAPLGFEDMTVLMGKSARAKYEGSYEGIAKAIRLYCADADPAHELQRFFEYVAFAVMVRNGDGHLKNFGLLYEDPAATGSIRLAPLYDVVTTSIYGSTSMRTGITKYDRTLALNLAKSKSYPNRATLVDFGSRVCGVTQPDKVLERIADALTATLAEHKDRVDERLLAQMRTEWDAGTGIATRHSSAQ